MGKRPHTTMIVPIPLRQSFISFRLGRVTPLAGAGVLALAFPAIAAAQPSPPTKAGPVFADGQAQVVPAFQDSTQWIHEVLWVETEFDSDGDGKRDRVHVDVTRPRQTQTEGLKVPVIYESSPYYGGLRSGVAFWDVKQEIGAASPPRPRLGEGEPPQYGTAISNSYVGDWVPRGFAVVHSEAPGTGGSQGCATIGGDNEALAPKAVVDWLNGRARGFTTPDGDTPVVASWSTGKVGMIGTSYNGTLALAAATTGVEGLAAIVPVAPVSSFYKYYRSNGMVRSPGGYLGEDVDVLFDAINTGARSGYCAAAVRDSVLMARQDRFSGDDNAFWVSRDFLTRANRIKAAALIAHGFNDWNVMPEQSVRIYEALKKRGVPAQVYYHQGAHGGDPPMTLLNRWFTRYLYDVRNDVERDPRAWIVRNGSQETAPVPYADYPNSKASGVMLYPRGDGNGIGELALARAGKQGEETLTDSVPTGNRLLEQAERSTHRLLYATPPLAEAVHLSGWTKVALRVASSARAANLSVYLVALPATSDSAKVYTITRGWADPQNAASLSKSAPLVPGKFVTMHFDLQPTDHVVPAGMRLALMIFSSDRAFTLWPKPGTVLTVDVDATSVVLPVVGGDAEMQRVLGTASRSAAGAR